MLIRTASVVGLVALLAGCASGGAGADSEGSGAGATGAPSDSATESSTGAPDGPDPRIELAESMLEVTEFPLAGWVVLGTQASPLVDSTEGTIAPPPTVSEGTAPTAAPTETLCGDGDVTQIAELGDSEGVLRTYQEENNTAAAFVEGLYFDESGDLAESIRGQIEECMAAGPVEFAVSEGIVRQFVWTTEGVTQSPAVFSAQFSAVSDQPTDIFMLSVANVDGVTMVGLSKTKQLRTEVEPEEYISIVEAAAAKLG
ncbi:hypothetical protein ACEXQD_08470 [Herbiconiux sp. P15]|uniref:hypothetical protein n=1 Tax=Herbiconiux liukaitaii TaxID=3342799 RepID=UPI0035B6DE6B